MQTYSFQEDSFYIRSEKLFINGLPCNYYTEVPELCCINETLCSNISIKARNRCGTDSPNINLKTITSSMELIINCKTLRVNGRKVNYNITPYPTYKASIETILDDILVNGYKIYDIKLCDNSTVMLSVNDKIYMAKNIMFDGSPISKCKLFKKGKLTFEYYDIQPQYYSRSDTEYGTQGINLLYNSHFAITDKSTILYMQDLDNSIEYKKVISIPHSNANRITQNPILFDKFVCPIVCELPEITHPTSFIIQQSPKEFIIHDNETYKNYRKIPTIFRVKSEFITQKNKEFIVDFDSYTKLFDSGTEPLYAYIRKNKMYVSYSKVHCDYKIPFTKNVLDDMAQYLAIEKVIIILADGTNTLGEYRELCQIIPAGIKKQLKMIDN